MISRAFGDYHHVTINEIHDTRGSQLPKRIEIRKPEFYIRAHTEVQILGCLRSVNDVSKLILQGPLAAIESR